jgi:hypothetical protein
VPFSSGGLGFDTRSFPYEKGLYADQPLCNRVATAKPGLGVAYELIRLTDSAAVGTALAGGPLELAIAASQGVDGGRVEQCLD